MKFSTTQKKDALKAVAIISLKITVAGVAIGYLHDYDFLLGILLLTRILVLIYTDYIKATSKNWILLAGMLLTGSLGVLVEIWGVSNGYWEYHDLTNNRQLPYWLPLAWMYAFRFIYKLERQVIVILKLKKLLHKTYLAIFITAVLPVFGEVITINLGVWTYSWPYQFLGVPLYAIICLVVLHMGINFLLSLVVRKKKIHDPVFINEK
ncbi:MAG: hypothetical protein JKY44_04485 [Flavobacteriaceae bacterium]|nr:hypothetical protein [Flavobacteriaceae bacterium]